MKKIIVLFVSVLLMVCMTGCSKAVDWDKDIKKLEDAGYTVTNHTSEEDLASITHELNTLVQIEGYDMTFEVLKFTGVVKNEDYDNQVTMLQFATEEQALNYYNFSIETRFEDSVNKYYVYKDIVVCSDNEESKIILGYDFK